MVPRANIAVFVEIDADGRIRRQENDDCYRSVAADGSAFWAQPDRT